jgi:parallel beta-helix repeat protein
MPSPIRPRLLLAAALGLAALAPGARGATTYYVAVGGDDLAAGDSGHPWQTLQHAADTVGPGDTVIVRGGDYDAFELTSSGTVGQRITFVAATGEIVHIVSDVPGRGAGINLEGASYVTIDGFRIADRATVGIRAVLCDGVTLRDNVLVHNGTWGILTGCCDDLLIEGNLAAASVVEHGIYVSNSGDRPTIRGNVIFDNHKNGIHMNGDLSVDCEGTTTQDGVISNALVEGNTIFGNGAGGGSGINCDGVQSSLIRNNLIYDTHASGISLYRTDAGAPASGNRVENNTVLVAADGRWALNIQNGSINNTAKNNILWSDFAGRGAIDLCSTCTTGFTSDYNAMENQFTLNGGGSTINLTQWRTSTGQDQHSFAIADSTALAALFVSSATANHRLATGSAAANAGTTIADLPTDLERAARPQGAAYDIGAFEGEGKLFSDTFETGATTRWSATVP